MLRILKIKSIDDTIVNHLEFYSYKNLTVKANIEKRSDIGESISNTTLNNYLKNVKVFFYWLEEN